MLNKMISLVVLLVLGVSWSRGEEEEAMSAVDLTEDSFKDKVFGFVHLRIRTMQAAQLATVQRCRYHIMVDLSVSDPYSIGFGS